MARELKPIVKLSRREGVALHPKAHKIMVKRTNPPGQHGPKGQRKPSGYALQLREKQKVKRMYGLLEKQFRKLITEAGRMSGQTGETLLKLLERRLDNAVYRAGLAVSRRAARQLVTHGHFILNGRRVDIPSIRVKPGDEIVLRAKAAANKYFDALDATIDAKSVPAVSWLNVDRKKLAIKVTGLPQREEAEPGINEQLIVEYYSR
jgi:small subunit ribosomal protein S4